MRLRTKNAEPHLLLHKHTETNPKDANMEGAFLPEGKTHPRRLFQYYVCVAQLFYHIQQRETIPFCLFPAFFFSTCCDRIQTKGADRMEITQNDRGYSPSERQYLIYRFLLENSNKDRVATPKQIRDYLQSLDIKISINTLYNDLRTLSNRETFNLQWEYDQKRKGYWVSNPIFEPREIRLLIDSVQASSFLTQTKADALVKKIRTLTDRYTLASLNRPTVVSGRVRSMNDSVITEADRLYQAIAEDSQIQFLYFQHRPRKERPKEYSNKGKKIQVSPYTLYWNNGFLYLYAYNAANARFQFYRVDRMEGITKPLGIKREGKEEYQKQTLTSNRVKVFDMYSGDEYDVKIRFHKTITSSVFDQFGKNNIVPIPDGDDHFTIKTRIQVSPPFYAWIATFGRKAKILEPPEVVKGMRDFLQKSMDMYKNDGETL